MTLPYPPFVEAGRSSRPSTKTSLAGRLSDTRLPLGAASTTSAARWRCA